MVVMMTLVMMEVMMMVVMMVLMRLVTSLCCGIRPQQEPLKQHQSSASCPFLSKHFYSDCRFFFLVFFYLFFFPVSL